MAAALITSCSWRGRTTLRLHQEFVCYCAIVIRRNPIKMEKVRYEDGVRHTSSPRHSSRKSSWYSPFRFPTESDGKPVVSMKSGVQRSASVNHHP